jgi:hypothetical protein
MNYSFIEDPRWSDLDEKIKKQMLSVAFDKEVASDSRWKATLPKTQQAMRDVYFEEARTYEATLKPEPERGFAGDIVSHTSRGFVSLAEHGAQGVKTITGGLLGGDTAKYLHDLPETPP